MADEDEHVAAKEERLAKEDEPVVSKDEPKTYKAIPGNHLIEHEGLTKIRGAGLENNSTTFEVESENPSATNVISTRRRLEFLSLPSELRVHVFRYLLLL